jgi:DNA polymerase-3 subunit beta
MKFSCEKATLLTGITTASRTVAVKSTIPVLEGLLIEASNDRLTISGYNLKTGIRTKCGAEVSQAGSVVINARLLIDIVRKMSDDVITVTVGQNYMVKLVCGLSVFEIMGTSEKIFRNFRTSNRKIQYPCRKKR